MFNYFTLTNLWTLIRQLLDIICVWAVVYYCLKIVKNNSRTIQIFKGVLLIIIVRALASTFELGTITNLVDIIMNWGVIAVIVIFQPEIRSILEKIGKTNVFSHISTLTVNERENLVDELVKACGEMSKTKTGALISIEQGHSLSDYIKTGTPMNSVVSSELLCSIFQYGTPLHDGAVIIQGVKIACAAAYFPPTTKDLPTSYGARHRAAVGISEITDSLTIVVSEETGNISVAEGGNLTVMSESALHEFLLHEISEQWKSEQEKVKKEAATKEEYTYDTTGKKPSVFSHYFKGKNKRVKSEDTTNTKYTKKKKDETLNNELKERSQSAKDKFKIEDLTENQAAPLDELFENIVEENPDKKEHKKIDSSQEIKKPKTVKEEPTNKKRGRKKKQEKIGEEKTSNTSSMEKESTNIIDNNMMHTMADDLLNDVIEPGAIVLHYEKAEDEESHKPEGSDS